MVEDWSDTASTVALQSYRFVKGNDAFAAFCEREGIVQPVWLTKATYNRFGGIFAAAGWTLATVEGTTLSPM